MKKLLSIVLALAMVLTLTIIPAYAEGTNVVYYVNGAIDGDAVAATAGETYKPDRMPTTAAPEGQYFVGWASEDGKIYADGFTLAEGENKLTAVYANYPVETKVNVTGQNYFNSRAYLPSYVEGKDPAYYPYIVPVTSGAVNYKYIAATEDQPAYMHWSNGQYGGNKSMIFTDENGNAIQGKWNTKYRITFKYRIPANEGIKKNTENEPAVVGIHFMMGFGAKVDMRDTYYTNQYGSGASGANWKFASMVDAGGVEFANCWDDWGSRKHGLGTISYKSDTYTSPSAITGDEWETMVYEITTPAADAAYFPVFSFNVRMDGWGSYKSLDQQMDIAEITITDTTKAEVQYIVNGEVESTVSGLTSGAIYTPDRMPTAATPAGKYFAGWKLNDKFVVDTVTLSYGINKLEAVYKNCVTGTVEADLLAANLPAKNGTTSKQVLLPMIYNGAYRGYVASGGWAGSKDGSDASGTFVNHYNGDTWGANTLKILHDSEGAALIAKPSTTYKIALTYRLTKYPDTFTLSYADWKASGENKSLRSNWSTYFMVGYNPTITSPDSFANGNGQNGTYGKAAPQEHSTWYDHGYGLGFWKDIAGDGEWHTEVFQITTHSAEKYAADGYLPVFSYCYNGPSKSYAVDFKSVVITEVAGTVNYYVGEEIEKSVSGLNIGSAFTPDYVPTATPEGKFFAGWKDASGNFVTEAVSLEIGDNNFYAVFGDIVDNGESVKAHIAKGRMYYANFDSNGENFQATLPGGNFWWTAGTTEFEGKTYDSITYTSSNNVKISLVDENNLPIVFQPGKAYNVSVKFKTSNGAAVGGMCLAGGFNASNAEGLRNQIGASFQKGGKQAINAYYSSQDHNNLLTVSTDKGGWNSWQWNVTSGGHASYNLPACNDWQVINFSGNMAADYTGYYPVFMLNFSLASGCTVLFDEIIVSESTLAGKLETGVVNGKEVGYVKIADNVEDNATYRITVRGASNADYAWVNGFFATADADNFASNLSVIEGGSASSFSFGYAWEQNATRYITVDKANGQGDALYVYFNLPERITAFTVIAIEKVDSISNEKGAAILKDQPADATQALRFFFDYNTTTGSDIVLGGKNVTIASRGFIIADASKIGDAAVTRATANSVGAIDLNTTDLTKCWEVTNTGTGVETLTFSTYITGFKAVDGSYNNTHELYVKGYVVLSDGSVVYSAETVTTVAAVANGLGLIY